MAATLAGLALLTILYTYIGYPILLGAFASLKNRAQETKAGETPPLTVVIAVFNDAAVLDAKISSLVKVSYPRDRLQLVVVDDGSTDNSAEVALAWRDELNVEVVRLPQNQGKPSALNAALDVVKTDITVFMDARQRVATDCLERIVRRFDDANVGAVSGELNIVDEHNPEQVSVGLYWRYEKWLREKESLIYSTAGATGAIYAIRTELYQPLDANTVLDDFDTPIHVLQSGSRVVFEPGALVYDSSQENLEDEFQRKLRTLAGNFQSFHRHGWLFNPHKNPIFWQFISHKVMRVAVPWLAMLLLICSGLAALDSVIWTVLFLGQVAFYGAACVAYAVPAFRRSRLISFALTFCQLNVAAALAPFRYYGGHLNVRWRS